MLDLGSMLSSTYQGTKTSKPSLRLDFILADLPFFIHLHRGAGKCGSRAWAEALRERTPAIQSEGRKKSVCVLSCGGGSVESRVEGGVVGA